ncbi:hypothetical protein FHX05_005558, partial [Rhizobium sp. BK491]|nr:hypothetical protein [Rhizobium sp. BK491]
EVIQRNLEASRTHRGYLLGNDLISSAEINGFALEENRTNGMPNV